MEKLFINRSITFSCSKFIALFLLLIFTSSFYSSNVSTLNTSDNYVNQQGYNTVFINRQGTNGDNMQVTYSIVITSDDVNKILNVTFSMRGWSKNNLSKSISDNPYLTIIQENPFNKNNRNYTIDFGTAIKTISFQPTVIGTYKFRVFFNYPFDYFSSTGSDLGTNININIFGFSGFSWSTADAINMRNRNRYNLTDMRDLGMHVLYWLNFNKSGNYYLGLQLFTPSFSDQATSKLSLTNQNNKSDQIIFDPTTSNSFNKVFNIQISDQQTGLWSLEYQEDANHIGMFYVFTLQNIELNYLPFYYPLSDSSSPKSPSLTSQGMIIFTSSVPFDELSGLIALPLVVIFRKKK